MKNLKSWTPEPHSEFQVSASIERRESFFQISFLVTGPLESLILPPLLPHSTRADDLWKGTCFEAFWGEDLDADKPYYEMNFSPSGQWNLYSLKSYRKNLEPVTDGALKVLHYSVASQRLEFSLEFSALCQSPQHVAVTAILRDKNQISSYWSLAPIPGNPDFHHIGNRCLHL